MRNLKLHQPLHPRDGPGAVLPQVGKVVALQALQPFHRVEIISPAYLPSKRNPRLFLYVRDNGVPDTNSCSKLSREKSMCQCFADLFAGAVKANLSFSGKQGTEIVIAG